MDIKTSEANIPMAYLVAIYFVVGLRKRKGWEEI
jgi:hypothetical protein